VAADIAGYSRHRGPDEARSTAQAPLALDPSFAIRRFRAGATSDDPTRLALRERLYDGMRKAGVPEK
jgi:hypothetical protein